MKLIPVMAALESSKSSFLCTSRHMGAIQLTPSVVRTCLERLGDVQALVLQPTVHAQNFCATFLFVEGIQQNCAGKQTCLHSRLPILCFVPIRFSRCDMCCRGGRHVTTLWQLMRRIEAKSKISKRFVDIRKHTREKTIYSTQPFGWIYLMCGGQAAHKNFQTHDQSRPQKFVQYFREIFAIVASICICDCVEGRCNGL